MNLVNLEPISVPIISREQTARSPFSSVLRALSHDLKQAIERSELTLVYQPQVEILTGRMVGIEALVRWQHPVHGEISPSKLFPIAEKTGIIHDLGAWILKHACSEVVQLSQNHQLSIRLSVNVSPCQLESDDFLELVSSILVQTEFKPEQLLLELAQSPSSQDLAKLISVMQRLQQMGIAISLSESGLNYQLGGGYAMQPLLQLLPINQINFDRHFVARLHVDPEIEMRFYGIVNLAKRLNIPFTAVGVETMDQIEFFTWHGGRILQGYWYGRPCPVMALRSWLGAGRGQI